jgi:hypothetical protein
MGSRAKSNQVLGSRVFPLFFCFFCGARQTGVTRYVAGPLSSFFTTIITIKRIIYRFTKTYHPICFRPQNQRLQAGRNKYNVAPEKMTHYITHYTEKLTVCVTGSIPLHNKQKNDIR